MTRHLGRLLLFLACLLGTSCETQPTGRQVAYLCEYDHGFGSAFEMFYMISSGSHTGKRHGPCRQFWGEGAVTVGQYRDGVQDGTWTCYRPDGSVRLITEYKDGCEVGMKCVQGWDEILKKERQRDGPWTCNFANTQVKACQGQYDKGEMVGVWTYWNPHGRIWNQSRYEKGSGLAGTRTSAPWWDNVTDQNVGVALPRFIPPVFPPGSLLREDP